MNHTLTGYLQKTAEDDSFLNTTVSGKQVSQFTPVRRRRALTAEEQRMIAEESTKWLPRIFRSAGDPIAVDLASPEKTSLMQGLGAGAAGAAVGGLAGAGIGKLMGQSAGTSAKVGAAAVGIPVMLTAALIAFNIQRAKNRTLEDFIARMPQGATRRDLQFNPAYQAEQGEEDLMQTARINAAMRGRYNPQLFGG